MKQYILESSKKSKNKNKQYKIHNTAFVFAEPFEKEIDLNYIKNKIEDLIHETAHSLEAPYGNEIYGDGRLEREFLAKRKMLYHLLGDDIRGIESYENPDYDYKFDQHLYKNIGYDKLRTVSSGLFYSPYAVTALREYWANGFENYLLGNKKKLKELSPALYDKLEALFDPIL